MQKMLIEIWSDIACPYCYIGKRRLEEALCRFPHSDKVDIVWHSYELNPDLPLKPINKSIYEFIASQYNITAEQQKENMDKIASIGKSVSLDFDFDKVVVANTSLALQLVKLAARHNLANEAEEALFEAYFSLGKDISDKDILMNIANHLGLPEAETFDLLEKGNLYEKEVKEDTLYSEKELNLEYIPFYRFNGQFFIQGSVTIEEYLDILNKAYNSWIENKTPSDGNNSIQGKACSIDGVCEI